MSAVLVSIISALSFWLPVGTFSVLLLAIIFFLILRKPIPPALVIGGIRVSVALLVLRALALSVTQYLVWKRDPLSQYLLPPHESIWYFLGYAQTHYFASLLYTLGGAVVVGLILVLLHRTSHGRALDRLDVQLGALGALASGFPNVILYFGLVLALASFWTLAGRVFSKRGEAVYTPLTAFFPSVALLVLIGGNTLAQVLGLTALRV